ncbi:MAG: hypothetical protein DRP54_07565, partial [Spirochaetes bacterium]
MELSKYMVKTGRFFIRHRLLLVYAFLAIAMIIYTDGFFNAFNLASILGLSSIMGFLVIGEALVIITGGIDLSVGNVASFSSVICAWTMLTFADKLPTSIVVVITVLFGILCGVFVGFINGFSVAKLKITPLIATLGGFWIAVGLAEYIFSGVPTPLAIKSFSLLGRLKVLKIFPLPFIFFSFCSLLVFIILEKMRIGRYVYAVG